MEGGVKGSAKDKGRMYAVSLAQTLETVNCPVSEAEEELA